MLIYGIRPKRGSHSFDEKSRDQWVKRKVMYVRVGLCLNINKIKQKINTKVSGKN